MNTQNVRMFPEDIKKLDNEIKTLLLEKFPELNKVKLTRPFLINQVIDYALENLKKY